MQASEIAQQVRQWRKRLHPDKFFSKYKSHLPRGDRSMASLTQQLTKLLESISRLKREYLEDLEEGDT